MSKTNTVLITYDNDVKCSVNGGPDMFDGESIYGTVKAALKQIAEQKGIKLKIKHSDKKPKVILEFSKDAEIDEILDVAASALDAEVAYEI